MGSGKSHVGRELAERLGLQFIDLDEWIENQQERTIAAIFAAEGETSFRALEQKALHDMAALAQVLIATGGGTPCFFDNMTWMNQHGITIYLQTPVPVLVQRLLPQREKRPLLQHLQAEELTTFIQNKLAERVPFYEQAQVIYQITSVHENVAERLSEQLSTIIGH